MDISIKSQKEIEKLKAGGKRLAGVLRAVVDATKPGVLPADLNELAEEKIAELGDEAAFLHYTPKGARRPYPASLCVSINDEIVHGIPNEGGRRLEEGDIVSFDIGLVHDGLVTDTAYTVGVGHISDEDKQLLETTRHALSAGIRAVRAGGNVGDIGHAIESYVRSRGYAIYRELVGHGTGYQVHESPYVPNVGELGTGPKLQAGMVIAIEPMIGRGGDAIELLDDGYTYRTADGSRSAHFEHTIAISEDGPEILTLWDEEE